MLTRLLLDLLTFAAGYALTSVAAGAAWSRFPDRTPARDAGPRRPRVSAGHRLPRGPVGRKGGRP